MDERRILIQKLLSFPANLQETRELLSVFPWDFKGDPTMFRSEELAKILLRALEEERLQDLEEWANVVECREDADFENGGVKASIFELANPVLYCPNNEHKVGSVVARLKLIPNMVERCSQLIVSCETRNATDIQREIRAFLEFCEAHSQIAEEFKSHLEVGVDGDSPSQEEFGGDNHYAAGISYVSWLFPGGYIEENLAEAYEWCKKVCIAHSNGGYSDDVAFEAISEIFDHVYPMHLVPLKEAGATWILNMR